MLVSIMLALFVLDLIGPQALLSYLELEAARLMAPAFAAPASGSQAPAASVGQGRRAGLFSRSESISPLFNCYCG